MTRLHGSEAIRYAEANDLPLCKYDDPTEEAREDLTIQDARLVVREDPRLAYIDVPEGRYQVRVIGDDRCSQFGDLLYATDDRAAAEVKADELATGEYYGVAVVDTVEHVADCGTDDSGKPIVVLVQ